MLPDISVDPDSHVLTAINAHDEVSGGRVSLDAWCASKLRMDGWFAVTVVRYGAVRCVSVITTIVRFSANHKRRRAYGVVWRG